MAGGGEIGVIGEVRRRMRPLLSTSSTHQRRHTMWACTVTRNLTWHFVKFFARRFFDRRSRIADGQNMGTDERSELRGGVLESRYRVKNCVGVGGTGVVFSATRLSDGANLVIKTLRPKYAANKDLVRRLRRESEVANRVAHPGIVPVIDEGHLPDGSPFIVMEHAHGEGLNTLLRRHGTLSGQQAALISQRVADILHRVHAQGYVHRDVKPEHILLDQTDSGHLRVTLLDFGICASRYAAKNEREDERGRVFGTPSYSSPEQASGNPYVDARSDIFGMGIVMFEMVTGRQPFRATNVTSLLRRIIREDAPRAGLIMNNVDRRIDAVIARSLSRDIKMRFSSARGLSRALSPLIGNRAVVEKSLLALLDRDARHANEAETLVQDGHVAA